MARSSSRTKSEPETKTDRYAKHIDAVDQHEDRPGQTLVARNHDVIRDWAEERRAQPATVKGSRHDDHVGVLLFDFPGYAEAGNLEHISWDEWFKAFDERKLESIYQEHLADGRMSNFHRLENPQLREQEKSGRR
jgi:hypothetical protein